MGLEGSLRNVNIHRPPDSRSTRPLPRIVTLLGIAAALAGPCRGGARDFAFPFTTPRATGGFARPHPPDAEPISILPQVTPANLQQTVRTLVGFGTRHTASSQTDPVRGIGAATGFVVA